MKKWISRLLLIILFVAIGVWGWWTFVPSPERVIRRNLKELAQAVSFNSKEGPLAQVGNATKVTSYFTADAEIIVEVPGFARMTLNGMDELRPAALRARSELDRLKVDFPDVSVSVPDPQHTAIAEVTARGAMGGQRDFQIQELRFTFSKSGRNWLIRTVETVKTLR